MTKKLQSVAFIAVFLLLCLVPSVGLWIYGPSEAGANERLADVPQLQTEEGDWNTNYLSELAQWVNDRFFLRQELISVDRWLSAHVLHSSGESSVILGRDGWLYFGQTLDDYTGTQPLTPRELFSIGKNLQLMAEYCRDNGKEFLFVIAPNKNSLYDAYMPNFGVKAEVTDADRLLAQLQSLQVNTVDLFAAFDTQETLYFAHDSHWNSKGAALGADLINAAFGVESNYFSGDFSQSEPHDGDLYAMLYPAFSDPETNPVYGGTLNFSFTTNATRPDAIVLSTAGSGQGHLLAYRDSFGILLFPYLADSYGTAKFTRSTTFDITADADYILLEIVERNLDYLIASLPVMPAPQRNIELPATSSGSISVETGKRGKLTQITGMIPQMDDDSCVYVLSGGIVYEAFALKNNGFGVNLPEGSEAEAVVYTLNGQFLLFEIH